MFRTIKILGYGFRTLCPACGYGHMYRSMWKLNLRCPVCGMVFVRDSGDLTGGIWINGTITSAVAVIPALYFAFFTKVPLLPLFLILALITTIVGVLFHRPARGLWISIMYLTGSIHEH